MKRRVFSHCRRPEVKSEERASGKGFSVAGNFKEPGTGRANVENRSKKFFHFALYCPDILFIWKINF